METLLRDLEAVRTQAADAKTEARLLSYLVHQGRYEDAGAKAEKILAGSPRPDASKVMDFMQNMCSEMTRGEGLKDEELIDDVFNEVWGNLNMASRGSAVLEELVRRFRVLTIGEGADPEAF